MSFFMHCADFMIYDLLYLLLLLLLLLLIIICGSDTWA
jgi:hypothetical protein